MTNRAVVAKCVLENAFITAESGLDSYCVKVRFDTLQQMQDFHQYLMLESKAKLGAGAVPLESSMKLDKPAKVGFGSFGVGVSWATVISAAQRNYEYHTSAEYEWLRDADPVEMQTAFRNIFGTPPQAAAPQPAEVAGEDKQYREKCSAAATKVQEFLKDKCSWFGDDCIVSLHYLDFAESILPLISTTAPKAPEIEK